VVTTNWKMGQMGEDAGPRLPSGGGDNNATGPIVAGDQAVGLPHAQHQAPPTRPPVGSAPPTRPAPGAAPPTRPAGQAPATQVPPGQVPFGQPPAVRPPAGVTAAVAETGDDASSIVRYGPGVSAAPPESQAALTAGQVWQTGRLPEPPRRPAQVRRLLGTALTVILLAASGVILFFRFHHAPFSITAVTITQQTHSGCGVDVTGEITTNGAAGTVHFQWVSQLGGATPRPLSQSVVSGQTAVYVTDTIQGQGHGSASETVTLQVLGPDAKSASTGVVITC
jgi:hypothetical protein